MTGVRVSENVVSRGMSVAGRRVVVVGGGRSGVAAAELLVARGARVTLSECRDALETGSQLIQAGIALELGGHRVETLVGADLVVLSPGVPIEQPALAAARTAGVPIISEIELAAWFVRGRVVAVTGTKGKSTTTTLAGRILAEAGRHVLVGGNIGPAFSAQVSASRPESVHVVEVSSFQLAQTDTFHPWVAVFLNFSPDHLDRHATVEEYAEAKARIFANQTAADWAVVNADDSAVVELARRTRARILPFALDVPLEHGIVVSGSDIVHRDRSGDRVLAPLAGVRLLGRHLLGDVLAAAAVGVVAGASPEAVARGIAGFGGLEHAFELVAEIDGVRFINDSKATNVEAARRSIESAGQGVVPILGGKFKGGDLRDLRVALEGRARAVVAIGEARPLVNAALRGIVPLHDADSMAAAVRLASELAGGGGTVLLAPACASFDMFQDYAERGRIFKQEVARLAEEARRPREQ